MDGFQRQTGGRLSYKTLLHSFYATVRRRQPTNGGFPSLPTSVTSHDVVDLTKILPPPPPIQPTDALFSNASSNSFQMESVQDSKTNLSNLKKNPLDFIVKTSYVKFSLVRLSPFKLFPLNLKMNHKVKTVNASVLNFGFF